MMDSVPLVAITGQVPRKLIGTDGFQVWARRRLRPQQEPAPAARRLRPGAPAARARARQFRPPTRPRAPPLHLPTAPMQETPIVEVTRAITKHNYLVMDIKDLPRVIKEAFYLARCATGARHRWRRRRGRRRAAAGRVTGAARWSGLAVQVQMRAAAGAGCRKQRRAADAAPLLPSLSPPPPASPRAAPAAPAPSWSTCPRTSSSSSRSPTGGWHPGR
jgi:hypothetical protein